MSSLFEKEWFPDNHGFLGPVLVLGPGMSMWKAAVRHERHGVTYLLTQRRLAAKAILPITSLQVSLYPSGIIRPQIAGS